MFTTDPRYALVVARDHARGLHLETAAVRLLRPSATRRALAHWLRGTADRLDRTRLVHRPA